MASERGKTVITGNNELPEGGSRVYRVRIKTRSGEYEGEMFSPFPSQRLSEALHRLEGFVNLKGARDLLTEETFPFMVISKDHIETIKVVEEK